MQRVAIVGSSGSGKTTLGRLLSLRLGLPYLELDGVYHQPGWQPLAPELFIDRVDSFTSGLRWVVDGNYMTAGAGPLIWERADTIVWLDLARGRVMWRLARRTAARVLLREELWNGNRERLRNLLRREPQDNVLLWAWTRFTPLRQRYEELTCTGAWAHASVYRLRTSKEVRTFLSRLDAAVAPGRSSTSGSTSDS